MGTKFSKKIYIKLGFILSFLVLVSLLYIYRDNIFFIEIFSKREKFIKKIESYGFMAPFVFIFIQSIQVIIAPIPGQISGLVGGYLFGAFKGFMISSFALTLGSVFNFLIARYTGRDIIKLILPERYFQKFENFFEEEGKIFVFALFLFPGFPKDYFCFFLGVTNIRFLVFFLFTFIGRMPGTLLLSIQGEMLYHGSYFTTGIIAVIMGTISFLLIFFRKKIHQKFKKDYKL